MNGLLGDAETIPDLLLNNYGNYVVQKALAVAKDRNYFSMISIIGSNLESLRYVTFGTKLINKLISTYPELQQYCKLAPVQNNSKASKTGKK